MYCPVCKEERQGKFCPECGTRLVAEHLKSDTKLQCEWNERFIKFGKDVIADGLGVEKENGEQETVCRGTDASGAARSNDNARSASGSGVTPLSRRDSVLMSAVERNIDSNNAEALEKQIERLAVLVSNYSVDVVSYKYYMLLAALRPKELINLYEANTANGYWQTFWVAVAYLKCNDVSKSDNAIVGLDRYSEYPEDNSLLLSALRAYAESSTFEAEEYMNEIVWNECTPLLLPFVKAASLVIAPERAEGIAVDNEKCNFYIENMVSLEMPEEKAARRKEELSKLVLIPIVNKKGKWGYVDAENNEVIPCKYDDAFQFCNGLAKVKLGGKWGFIDKEDNEVVPVKYDSAYEFNELLTAVNRRGKWGYIDINGNEVVPFKYDDAEEFSDGFAKVELKGKWGYINASGKEVVPCKYDDVDYFLDGFARVELKGKKGYVDVNGKEVVSCKYNDVSYFEEGLVAVDFNGKWGYVNESGKEVIPCKYDRTWNFSEGLASVELNGKYGFIDKSGREVVPCKYEYACDFSEGLALVSQRWKDIFIDKRGNEALALGDDIVMPFCEGLAKVIRSGGKCGYIDKSGREVVPCKYEFACDFYGGLAQVELNGKKGCIDRKGCEIVPCKYDEVYSFSDGLAEVELGGKWGVVDKSGKEIIPCKYDETVYFYDGLARVELNGKEFYIDKTGKEYIKD